MNLPRLLFFVLKCHKIHILLIELEIQPGILSDWQNFRLDFYNHINRQDWKDFQSHRLRKEWQNLQLNYSATYSATCSTTCSTTYSATAQLSINNGNSNINNTANGEKADEKLKRAKKTTKTKTTKRKLHGDEAARTAGLRSLIRGEEWKCLFFMKDKPHNIKRVLSSI